MRQKLVYLFIILILFLGSPRTERLLSDLEYSVMVWRLRFIFGTWKQFVFGDQDKERNVNVTYHKAELRGRIRE